MRFVYFVQNIVSGAIKIGSSVRPLKRLVQLQLGSEHKLVILFVTPLVEERDIHREFAAFRIRREWYSPAPEILERIETLKDELEASEIEFDCEAEKATEPKINFAIHVVPDNSMKHSDFLKFVKIAAENGLTPDQAAEIAINSYIDRHKKTENDKATIKAGMMGAMNQFPVANAIATQSIPGGKVGEEVSPLVEGDAGSL
jgi:hypothetical protein